ncbi:hypothetical protein B0H63DRAFT_473869 [Podospora didyma]|uniref:Uncharacterized protein n=1 Tax=Podospora didyma TaxID=330526 RepID=A0AAE0NR03_9PEZI|nr:hypothetical protein B0H63DRAFT_473869 [Podospora didyma]
METSFNSSDDQVFTRRRGGFMNESNPLWECMPSTLEFTRKSLKSCQAAYAYNFLVNRGAVFGGNATEILGAGLYSLNATLPGKFAPGSITDAEAVEYVDVLYTRPLFSKYSTIQYNVLENCASSGEIGFAPGFLNYTLDCTVTTSIYRTYFLDDYQRTAPLEYDDVLELVKASFPDRDALPVLSNNTLFNLFNNSRNASDIFGRPETEFLVTYLRLATDTCALDACRALNYAGNGDMAGTGVMAAYSSIAALSTSALVIVLVYKFLPRWRSHYVIQAAFRALEAFRGTMMFFSFMTAIAGFVLMSQTKSYYETKANLLISTFCADAVMSLRLLTRYDNNVNQYLGLSRYSSLITLLLLFSLVLYLLITSIWRLSGDKYEDFTCVKIADTGGSWNEIVISLQVGYLFFYISIIIAMSIREFKRYKLPELRRARTHAQAYNNVSDVPNTDTPLPPPPPIKQSRDMERDPLYDFNSFNPINIVFSVLAILLMWTSLLQLQIFRKKSEDLYGESFGDTTSVGYGQIVAMGFCAETVALFFFVVIHEHFKTHAHNQEGPIDPDHGNIVVELNEPREKTALMSEHTSTMTLENDEITEVQPDSVLRRTRTPP